MSLPSSARVRAVLDRPPTTDGRYVLYWMLGARRASWNAALDRAVDWALALGKPLMVLEALNCDYPWASDRLHSFVLDGMADNKAAFDACGVGYYPYVEPAPGAGRGLLRAMAAEAAVVVTDRSPVFVLPSFVSKAAPHLNVRFEEVDGNGLLPLDAAPSGHVYPTAYAFRRFIQRVLPEHLSGRPRASAVRRGDLPVPSSVPVEVEQRWPRAPLLERHAIVGRLPVDHSVGAVPHCAGGTVAAGRALTTFLESLDRYDEDRSHPDDDAASGLSPYLHFGHVSPHEVAGRVLKHDGWTKARLSRAVTGAKTGWWGASVSAEAFLDQLVTWRELGLNMAARRPDYERFESLPPWALRTLDAHAADPRPYSYSLAQCEAAATHDPLWNAAQRQLVRDGRMHNYLRMLWGKKILEWTASPREALRVMVELNNRYALDGRDPNSYSGIFWVLGRYDRPWPERPIYGTVRYMTSASTARKLRVKAYLARYGGDADAAPPA